MSLYIVATPIGNLEDISFRALKVLKEVHCIVAEDTRHTRKLLTHYDIHTPLISFFEHKEETKLKPILDQLEGGKNLALVSDAGTPSISDPGFRLVRAAIAAGLGASGLPTDHFFFAGFLPEKPGKRKKEITFLAGLPHTLIIYLSVWKAQRQVEELAEILGERVCCMGREITKLHEEFWRGTLQELSQKIAKTPPKGEITLVIAGKE